MTPHHPRGVRAFAILLRFVLSSCYKSAVHQPEPQLQIAIDARNPVLQLPIYVAVEQRLFAVQRLRITVQDFPAAWLSGHRDQAFRIARAIAEAQTFIRKHKAKDLLPMVPESYRNVSAPRQAQLSRPAPCSPEMESSLLTARKLYAKFWAIRRLCLLRRIPTSS